MYDARSSSSCIDQRSMVWSPLLVRYHTIEMPAVIFIIILSLVILSPVWFQVNQLVSRAETKKGCKQVSIFKSSFTSDFYFFPGLQEGMVSSHSETDMAGSNSQSAKAPSSVQQTAMPQQTSSVQTAMPQQTSSVQPSVPQQPAPCSPAVAMGKGITAQPSDTLDGTLVEWGTEGNVGWSSDKVFTTFTFLPFLSRNLGGYGCGLYGVLGYPRFVLQ